MRKLPVHETRQDRLALLIKVIGIHQKLRGYAPTNRHLALLFGVHEVTMSNWMSELQEIGCIRRGYTRRALIEIVSASSRMMR